MDTLWFPIREQCHACCGDSKVARNEHFHGCGRRPLRLTWPRSRLTGRPANCRCSAVCTTRAEAFLASALRLQVISRHFGGASRRGSRGQRSRVAAGGCSHPARRPVSRLVGHRESWGSWRLSGSYGSAHAPVGDPFYDPYGMPFPYRRALTDPLSWRIRKVSFVAWDFHRPL